MFFIRQKIEKVLNGKVKLLIVLVPYSWDFGIWNCHPIYFPYFLKFNWINVFCFKWKTKVLKLLFFIIGYIPISLICTECNHWGRLALRLNFLILTDYFCPCKNVVYSMALLFTKQSFFKKGKNCGSYFYKSQNFRFKNNK